MYYSNLGPRFGRGNFYELGVEADPFNKCACISFVGEGSFAIIEGSRNMLLDYENKVRITDRKVTTLNGFMISELEVWHVVFYN